MCRHLLSVGGRSDLFSTVATGMDAIAGKLDLCHRISDLDLEIRSPEYDALDSGRLHIAGLLFDTVNSAIQQSNMGR